MVLAAFFEYFLPLLAESTTSGVKQGVHCVGITDCHTSDFVVCKRSVQSQAGHRKGRPYEGVRTAQKTKSSPAKPPRTMLCTVIPPCFAACSRRAASWSADTLPRCHGRTRPHLMPAGPRHGGSGAMFPRLFRARFHLAGLSLAV